jgi:alpha-ribazole phosphatase/probable phosphoglycerate mutase
LTNTTPAAATASAFPSSAEEGSQATTVWLIRHGSPQGVNGRCYGRQDISLSVEGVNQAKQISNRLAAESISHIYSSNLKRAFDTGKIIAEPHDLTVQTVEDLGEIHFGDLEGLTYEEIQTRRPDIFESWMARPAETQFPNGESFQQMSVRVLRAFDSLISNHRNQSIAVVAHSGVIRVLLGNALSIPSNEIFRLAQRYGAINRICYFEHGPIVELING